MNYDIDDGTKRKGVALGITGLATAIRWWWKRRKRRKAKERRAVAMTQKAKDR